MKVYISGKITGLPKTEYTKLFNEAVLTIIKRGDTYVCPTYLKPLFGIESWFCYMIVDIIETVKCNRVYMLENWKSSKGAIIEHWIAELIGMEIEYKK